MSRDKAYTSECPFCHKFFSARGARRHMPKCRVAAEAAHAACVDIAVGVRRILEKPRPKTPMFMGDVPSFADDVLTRRERMERVPANPIPPVPLRCVALESRGNDIVVLITLADGREIELIREPRTATGVISVHVPERGLQNCVEFGNPYGVPVTRPKENAHGEG